MLLVVLLYLVFVGTIRGQRLDNAAMKGRQTLDSQQIKDADELLRTIDIASVALIGGAIALVAVAFTVPSGRWPRPRSSSART